MTEPNEQQMERLREIAREHLRKFLPVPIGQISWEEMNNALLTVWREAQEEIAKSETSLYAIWEKDQKAKEQLEASLRLAVSAMEKITCQCDYLKRLQVQSICFRCTTLSTIRASHPQLFGPIVGPSNTEKP
jgi:hypothetical protein